MQLETKKPARKGTVRMCRMKPPRERASSLDALGCLSVPVRLDADSTIPYRLSLFSLNDRIHHQEGHWLQK